MATLSHSESRRSYSWWWDSHISPKNSKWLQENLTDIDAKVKSMIKLIDEEADSFARRAEMYYKKRPELMKLVEEFYRAYRALAERYDHAMGELRHAHKTMAEAFPNQEHYMMTDDSLCVESHTPGVPYSESELSGKADSEVLTLRIALAKIQSDKDAIFLQYQKSLEKLSEMEKLEVKALRKNLADLNEEKESLAVLYHQCLEKISKMENEILRAQENSEKLNREIEKGAEKLETAEKHCDRLEKSNQSLQLEAENLAQKIAMKDQALLEKHSEIERLQTLMHEEHSHFLEIESTLQTLQKLYSKSQQEQGTLVMELKYGLQLLKNLDLSKQDNQVEELRASILVQKEKHANHKHLSEVRLTNLENLFHVLQEELRLGRIEFEKEVDKAVNAQIEMFILQSCIEDLEQKNLALLAECEKHVEASKFSHKVISELETENFMQLMEEEFLLHEIRKFKMAIHQVCGALHIDPYGGHDKGIKQQEIPISHVLDNIEGLKSSYVKSQEEKQQLLLENSVILTSLQLHRSEREKLESVSNLKDAMSAAEDENSVILHELLALSNLNLVYESFLTQKVIEQKALSEHLSSNLSRLNGDLNQELGVLRKNFEVKEAENVYLNESTKRMDKELREIKNANCRLKNYMNQKEEIEHLNEENRSFQSLMRSLRHEVEQHKVREQTLNSELLYKINEFQLCEAEAAAFYLELQISSISEELLKSKVTELTEVCQRIDDENAAKSSVIEQMIERIGVLENEIRGLKGQLSAYTPMITSLKEDFASLEHTYFLWTSKTFAQGNREPKDVGTTETCLQEHSYQSLRGNESTLIPDGVADLLNMQTRIAAIKKLMMRELERSVKEENLMANVEAEAVTEMIEDSNLEVATYPKLVVKIKKDNSTRDQLETEKELGVDKQELWKIRKPTTTSEDGKRKILERLASDSQKLAILKMTLQDLKKKPETKKKSNMVNEIEYETVKRHIEDVEEAVMQQIGIYDQLAKDIEECTSSSSDTMQLEKQGNTQRKRVTEQARRGSEQIGRLQFEVQNIQYILLKLSDVKNNKGKNRISRPTGVLLKDFIRIGKKNSRRRRKGCACGCSRPSTNED
uniref:NAB domain-containing protein n=1 Tax=Cajanus cajan TaxID=3821 RepID=A0A151SD82_CAJCA|nr:hypothetical protein KK1_025481 [Cajanus cajan]